jgi:hypothetical protein
MAQQSSGEFASTDPTTRTQDARLQVGAGLIADKKGALYGTTNRGGSGGFFLGFGTVFKLTPPANGQTAWTETALYSFKGGSEALTPPLA